jgi:periplasmic protein TonB
MMAAPLRSTNPGDPQSMQFAHFGVLDAGGQSKTSTITSVVVNVLLAFVIVVIGAATKQSIDNRQRLTQLALPIEPKKVEPIKPKIIPPKPKIPELAKVEPPKITIPQIKVPEPPKEPVIKMEQVKPVLLPVAPKQVIAPAAPKVVSLAHPEAASVPNHDPHPTAVALGNTTSPLSNLKGPAVAPVNMGQGMPGMNSANSGHGPAATHVVMGSGSPESTTVKGNGVVAVAGIPHGVPGGTGTGRQVAGQVNLGQAVPPPMLKPAAVVAGTVSKQPTVTSKPKPEYTAEAIQMHIEGKVSIRIRVMADGSVQVLEVTKGLGHGLDESAKRAIQATKFEPARDASGQPIVWDGVVNVTFQLAG